MKYVSIPSKNMGVTDIHTDESMIRVFFPPQNPLIYALLSTLRERMAPRHNLKRPKNFFSEILLGT